MTRGALRLAAAACVALVAAVPLALNHGSGTTGVAPQAVDQPLADIQDGATIAIQTPGSAAPETVPPAPIDTGPTMVPTPLAAAPPTEPTATMPATTNPTDTRALALIRYPWARLGYQIAFHGPKAGFYGLTDCRSRRIDIYVATGQSVAQVAYVTAYEIGHAIDCSDVVAGHRAEWSVLRGFQVAGPWFPSCSCSEDSFGSGDFAEVFARWQVGPAYPWRSTLAPAPTAAQLGPLVALFG